LGSRERTAPVVHQYQALAIARYDAFLKRDHSRSKDWWYASVVAGELDRLLGHFDAVEARLNGLPTGPDRGWMQAISQIQSHALNHNSKQEKLRSLKERTRPPTAAGSLNK
jgi:hypothetical protein